MPRRGKKITNMKNLIGKIVTVKEHTFEGDCWAGQSGVVLEDFGDSVDVAFNVASLEEHLANQGGSACIEIDKDDLKRKVHLAKEYKK
jgi:hypothetical protein